MPRESGSLKAIELLSLTEADFVLGIWSRRLAEHIFGLRNMVSVCLQAATEET